MMKMSKTLCIRVSFFSFCLKENFLGEHSFLLINVKSENQGQEGSFYKQVIYDSFQWNLEPMWSKLVLSEFAIITKNFMTVNCRS